MCSAMQSIGGGGGLHGNKLCLKSSSFEKHVSWCFTDRHDKQRKSRERWITVGYLEGGGQRGHMSAGPGSQTHPGLKHNISSSNDEQPIGNI